MGIYLKAVDGPDIDSPNYIGTYGGNQSNAILTLIQHYQNFAAESKDAIALDILAKAEKRKVEEYRESMRIIHSIVWIITINNNAPKDTYEFRKYAIERGVDWWSQIAENDDDHVKGVRDAITKIAEHGQDVYET